MRAFVSPAHSTPGLRHPISDEAPVCASRPRHPHHSLRDRRKLRTSHWTLCTESRSSSSSSSNQSLAQRLACAFIDACQPGRKPYATALRDFCDTALAAYREGYSLQALQVELSTSGGPAHALRALQHDEVELRAVWLSLVYKTLRVLRYPAPVKAEADTQDSLDEFVKNIVSAVRAGYDMKRIQLEQSLAQKEKPRTTLESAILGQSTRLVVTTISAATDDLKGREGNDGENKPTT